MGSRGRQSKAELTTVVSEMDTRRPAPPAWLSKEEAQLWREVAATMPADYFGKEHADILAEYCRHACRARLLSKALDEFNPDALAHPDGIQVYDKLASAAEREGRALLACARSLRLTHQSRIDPKTAHGKSRRLSYYDTMS